MLKKELSRSRYSFENLVLAVKHIVKECFAPLSVGGSLSNFGDKNPLRVKAFLSNLGTPLKRIQ